MKSYSKGFGATSGTFFSGSLAAIGVPVKKADGVDFLSVNEESSLDYVASPPKTLGPTVDGPVDFVSTTFAEAVDVPSNPDNGGVMDWAPPPKIESFFSSAGSC